MKKLSHLDDLQKIRMELEEESRSLKKEQKECEERVKVLEEKIAIEELKKNNRLTMEVLYQLKSHILALDQKLEELSKANETPSIEVKAKAVRSETEEQVEARAI